MTKALILNSGTGSRMGKLTKDIPKCLVRIEGLETILSRQLRQLKSLGINSVIITTGQYHSLLEGYCLNLGLGMDFVFVNNPKYASTNYIYSIFLAKDALKGDVIMMHGDLIFDEKILKEMINSPLSLVSVSSTQALPDKDFKGVIRNGRVHSVGVEFFDEACTLQPLYKIKSADFKLWLEEIETFCKNGMDKVYAEVAFNNISDKLALYAYDYKDLLCSEVDTEDDLIRVKNMLAKEQRNE